MRVYVRRAISKHSYHSSEVGAYRWHYYAASTIDGYCNYILEGEPKKRFDWSIFWDLLIRWRAWRGLPKQSKSKLSYTPIEWIVIIISMNAVWIKQYVHLWETLPRRRSVESVIFNWLLSFRFLKLMWAHSVSCPWPKAFAQRPAASFPLSSSLI